MVTPGMGERATYGNVLNGAKLLHVQSHSAQVLCGMLTSDVASFEVRQPEIIAFHAIFDKPASDFGSQNAGPKIYIA